jgi:hypothetical protein
VGSKFLRHALNFTDSSNLSTKIKPWPSGCRNSWIIWWVAKREKKGNQEPSHGPIPSRPGIPPQAEFFSSKRYRCDSHCHRALSASFLTCTSGLNICYPGATNLNDSSNSSTKIRPWTFQVQNQDRSVSGKSGEKSLVPTHGSTPSLTGVLPFIEDVLSQMRQMRFPLSSLTNRNSELPYLVRFRLSTQIARNILDQIQSPEDRGGGKNLSQDCRFG